MIDQDDKVLPVAPVVGNKAIKIMSFGLEQNKDQPVTRKKATNVSEKNKKELICTVTADKVDCQI